MAAKINSKTRRLIKQTLSENKKKYPCVFCKILFDVDNLTIEHIIPKKEGGSNRLYNLALSCVVCNTNRDQANFYEYLLWMNNKDAVKPKGARSGGNKNRFYKRRKE